MEVPDVIQQNVAQELRSLILRPAEIEVILKSLPIGKAAGPDGISNRILRELATELSYPLCSLLISHYKQDLSLIIGIIKCVSYPLNKRSFICVQFSPCVSFMHV